MARQYIEPQVPLIQGENFYYPLTTAKQVILPDGRRLGGEKLNLTPSDIGVTATAEELNTINNKADINHIQTIEKGGTGATTAAEARTALGITPANIGAAKASHNHNIDNLTNFGTYIYDATLARTKNTFLAAPNGSDGPASFRRIAVEDLPTVSIAKGGTGATTAAAARSALGITLDNLTNVHISTTTPTSLTEGHWYIVKA